MDSTTAYADPKIQSNVWSAAPESFRLSIRQAYMKSVAAEKSDNEDDRNWGKFRRIELERIFGKHNLLQ